MKPTSLLVLYGLLTTCGLMNAAPAAPQTPAVGAPPRTKSAPPRAETSDLTPPPLSPAESLAKIHLPAGYRAEVVAAETDRNFDALFRP